jgi:Cu-Zn family superoxide dismutase
MLAMRSELLLLTVSVLAISGCAPNGQSKEAQHARTADGAKISLADREGDSVGTLTLAMESGGVRFTGRLHDLPAGRHGVHIHETGQCDAPDFKSAGAHFNPAGRQHGKNNPEGRHAGDLDNIDVDQSGFADVSFLADGVTLEAGTNSLLKQGGTSLVIHADPDDLQTDPSGNSGDRISCGVITR